MGWITTERDARVTKHRAMPVRDCPVIKGEIADPDGREMFKERETVCMARASWHYMHEL